MLFIILVAFSALFVAGCAAFFSIKGLMTLFSGSMLAIGIMASSLEIGKLVAASFLHTYWKDMRLALKAYLCLAVLVLMAITSLGIFGFLTSAYQVHASTVSTFESKIEALQFEKSSIAQAVLAQSNRIKTLAELRAAQEQRIKEAGNYKAPREQAYKAIAEANDELQLKETSLAKDRERIITLEKDIAELKISMNTTTDVGSFKFIASALGTSVDTSVQYFILALIIVFDPLAVALVLAWNNLLEERAKKKKTEEDAYLHSLSQLATIPTQDMFVPAAKEEPVTETVQEEPVAVDTPVIVDVPVIIAEEPIGAADESVPVEEAKEEPQTKLAAFKAFRERAKINVSVMDTVLESSVAEVADKDLEEHPLFLKMSPEQKRLELLRRSKTAGRNNSVITRG